MANSQTEIISEDCGIFCLESSELDYVVVFTDEYNKNPETQLSNNESTNKKTQVVIEGYYYKEAAAEYNKNPESQLSNNESWNKKTQVVIEGSYKEAAAEDNNNLTRTKSLTEGDLDDLKGCVDLGFGFSYEDIPVLCNTLPALELCYSMSQTFLDDRQRLSESPPQAGVTHWKISSPGDNPEEVKERLKYWAKAVACTVRLCS